MWYSIITTGKCLVTESYKEIKHIQSLYLYPKIRRHSSVEEANQFIEQFGYKEAIKRLRNYGNTIKGFTIHAKYKITKKYLYIYYDTRDIGEVLIKECDFTNVVSERTGYVTKMRLDIGELDNTTMRDHMRAVQVIIDMLGENFGLNIHIQYFSVYYALTVLPGSPGNDIAESLYGLSEHTSGIAWSYGDWQEEM